MDGFEAALKSLFQDLDKKRRAKREIAKLRQTRAASSYAADFRRLLAQLNCTEETKKLMFYNGLKERVKDELTLRDTLKAFAKYVELAVNINTCIYEREQKKKGRNLRNAWFPRTNVPKLKENYGRRLQYYNNSTAYGYYTGPIEVDNVNKKLQDKKNTKYYNC